MQRGDTLIRVAQLSFLVALGPLATDMYLPALPTLGEALGADVDQVQLTLSVFLVGFACGQLIYGPLSDRFGRRPIMIGGLLLFAAATLGCIHVQDIETLIALRFLQALGGCAGPVLGRAIVRDLYQRQEAAKMLSYMGTVMGLAPAIAPVLGAYLLVHLGWRSIFQALVLYGVLALLLIGFVVGESHHQPDPQALRLGRMLRNYLRLCRDRCYVGYSLSVSAVFAGLFAFISGSSFVFIDYYAYTPTEFGYFFGVMVAGYMTGTLLSARLAARISLDRLLIAGSWLCALHGILMAALVWWQVPHVAVVVGPMVGYAVGVGIVMPQGMAGAIGPYPQMAGVASALLGFVQMAGAALLGVLVGRFHDGTPLIMSLAMAGAGIITLLAAWLAAWTPRTEAVPG